MSALLQRVDDLARHIIFVVLGEHCRRGEDPIRAELAFGNDPLPFAEEIRQQTLIDNREIARAVGDAERELAPVRTAREAVRLDQPADPHPPIGGDGFDLEVARAVEEYEVVAERDQHQRGCPAQRRHSERQQSQPLLFAGHRLVRNSRCNCLSVLPLAR